MKISRPDVGYLINRISRLSQRWLDDRLAEFGFTSAAVPVLASLNSEGTLTQKELASRIGIEQPTMAQLLSRMERDGLIVRAINPEDGRSARVLLTNETSRILPAARRAIEDGYDLVTKDFSDRELATLERLLKRYLASIEDQLK